jgi:mannose-6-phosphate isomerase-like protein (cupin superfamily)
MVVSIENAEHYIWGEVCDGWHLLQRKEMSVIQERVPTGGAEVMHYHEKARQFFYILEGEGTMAFEDSITVLRKGQGIEIPPQVKHQFRNQSEEDVHFLVLSVPSTRGDRINSAPAAACAERRMKFEVEAPGGEDAA